MVNTRKRNYEPQSVPKQTSKKVQKPDKKTKSGQLNPDSTKEKNFQEKLNVLYNDITSKPSYSAKIAEFLRQHDTHGVYRRIVKKNFPRRKVIARFPFEIFMGDLIEY